MQRMFIALAVLAAAFTLAGCGKKADATTPVDQVKAQAQQLDATAIQAKIDAYKAAVAEKHAEIQKLAEKIKAIPIAEMLGDEAKKLKAESDKIQEAVQALTDRLQVYVDALQSKAAAPAK